MRTSIFMIICLSLILFSCGNETSSNDHAKVKKAENNIKPTSHSTKMYCRINGEQWQGGAINGTYIHETETDLVIVDIAGISPVLEEIDFTTMFNLNIRHFKGEGEYINDVSFSLKTLNRDIENKREEQSIKGRINVIDWDETNNIISGEFSAKIPSETKGVYLITDGVFTQIQLKNIVVD